MRQVCRIAMCLMVMLEAATFLSAQTNRAARSAVTTKDHKMTIITTAPSEANTPYLNENAGLKTIFSNLAVAYPNTPPFNIEWWHAAAFTPTGAATVERVVVSIGYLSGNDTTVILSLNADDGGIPGTAAGAVDHQ